MYFKIIKLFLYIKLFLMISCAEQNLAKSKDTKVKTITVKVDCSLIKDEPDCQKEKESCQWYQSSCKNHLEISNIYLSEIQRLNTLLSSHSNSAIKDPDNIIPVVIPNAPPPPPPGKIPPPPGKIPPLPPANLNNKPQVPFNNNLADLLANPKLKKVQNINKNKQNTSLNEELKNVLSLKNALSKGLDSKFNNMQEKKLDTLDEVALELMGNIAEHIAFNEDALKDQEKIDLITKKIEEYKDNKFLISLSKESDVSKKTKMNRILDDYFNNNKDNDNEETRKNTKYIFEQILMGLSKKIK